MERARNGPRRRVRKRRDKKERVRGRDGGLDRLDWSFYFFQKLIEIARDHLPVDLFRAWTNQINQMEWSRNEFGIIILHEECFLLRSFAFVLLVTGPPWSEIESWNRSTLLREQFTWSSRSSLQKGIIIGAMYIYIYILRLLDGSITLFKLPHWQI